MMFGVSGLIAGEWMYAKNKSLPDSLIAVKKQTVSIIIPARNEEKNLSRLLNSLSIQSYPIYEVIVVDDDSSDDTADIAKKMGATVLSLGEGEWTGKTNACWQGARSASGNLLLFLDADTWFGHPEALHKLLKAYQNQGEKGAVSVQPYHSIKKSSENLSTWFNILVIVGMNHVSVFGDKLEAAGLYGPCVLCSKKEYLRIGGHEKARHSLVEGFALGKAFIDHDLPISLYTGGRDILFQMYSGGFKELAEGWTKHLASGSRGTHVMIWVFLLMWIGGALGVPILLIHFVFSKNVLGFLVAFLIYSMYVLQVKKFAHRTGNFDSSFLVFYPGLLFFFMLIFVRSFIATHFKRSVTWKGRKMDL